jgi:DNA-binding CsgD family transcriptional regulator
MKFSDSALANLMRCQYDLGAPPDGRRVRQRLVEIVARAVHCQLALYLSVDADLRGGILTCWPEELTTPPLTQDLVEIHLRTHPLAIRLQRQRAARAWRLSDVDGGDRFRSQPLYQRVYVQLPARHQMAIRLASPDEALHAVAVLRTGDDFTDQERRSLELLWPSMVRYLRAAPHARSSPGGSRDARVRESCGVMLLRGDVKVALCTEQARVWLGRYFPQSRPRHAVTLPPPLAHWVRQRLAAERIGRLTPLSVREPLVQPRGDRYLCVDLVVDHAKGEHLLVLAEEALAAPATSMTALGLTPREREVLAWVAQGKSNPVIAQILGTSGRTVQKHLEHVFQKLGVESRTAATLRAWQASHYAMLHQA